MRLQNLNGVAAGIRSELHHLDWRTIQVRLAFHASDFRKYKLTVRPVGRKLSVSLQAHRGERWVREAPLVFLQAD